MASPPACRVRASMTVIVLTVLAVMSPVTCSPQDGRVLTVIDEQFTDGPGVFRLSRAGEDDIRLEGGTLSLIGRKDGQVRALDAQFGGPLPGRVTPVA